MRRDRGVLKKPLRSLAGTARSSQLRIVLMLIDPPERFLQHLRQHEQIYLLERRCVLPLTSGDDWASLGGYAWYGPNSDEKTHPVGQKKPNGWGLRDMHGNVYEWCQDWHDFDYCWDSAVDDPTGPDTALLHVMRGGCWWSLPRYCRAALRNHERPVYSADHLGFRVACSPSGK